MNITYTRQGDYLIPDLRLPEQEPRETGMFGRRYANYLKEYKRVTYCNLLTSGKLAEHIADVDLQAQELFDRLIIQMKEAEGIAEKLKEENPMEWVGRMNNIRSRAEEVVMQDIVYA